MALEPTRLEHPPRTQLVLRVLEDAAERAPVRRLRGLALRVQRAYNGLDLLRWSRMQAQLRLDDDLAVAQIRVAVREAELPRREPAGALGGRDERAPEHLREVAAVGAGVHPDAAANRAGDRAGELEAAEAGGARPVERNRVRGAAACAQEAVPRLGRRERTAELEDERVDARIGDEQVRAEPNRRDREVALGRPVEHLHLGDRARPSKRVRRAARAEGGVAGEVDVLLDRHASASRSSGPARSTSPAPSVSTVSPARAQPATIRAASSTDGANASRIPGRTCASCSTISRPLTPGSGSS